MVKQVRLRKAHRTTIYVNNGGVGGHVMEDVNMLFGKEGIFP